MDIHMDRFRKFERLAIVAVLASAFVVAVWIHAAYSRFSGYSGGSASYYRLDRKTGELWFVRGTRASRVYLVQSK